MALRRFLRDSALYGAANVVARGMVFLLLPLYTQILSQTEVGAFEWLTAASLTLMALLPLEVTQALARLRTQHLSVAEIHDNARSAFYMTVLVFTAFVLVIVVWALGPLHEHVFTTMPPQLLVAAAMLLWANGLLYFVQNELRWSAQADRYALTSVIAASVTAISAVVLLTVLQAGVLGLYVAMILGSFSGACVALRNLPYLLRPRMRSAELGSMLKFSFPLAISSVTIILATTVDRLLVAYFLDLESLGLYGVAMRIAAIAMLAFQGFQLAVLPATVGQGATADREARLERSFRVFLLIAIGMALLLASCSGWVLSLMAAPAYLETQANIPIILVGTVACAAYPFAPGLWLKGHSWAMAGLGLVLVALGLLMSWWLIPAAGVQGAAFAYAATGIVYGVLLFWASDRVFPVGRRYGRLVLSLGVFAVASGGIAWMVERAWAEQWRVLLATFAIGLVSLLLTTRYDREQLSTWIGKFNPMKSARNGK